MPPEPPLEPQPEPWLRGVLPELDPVIAHLLRASQQIQEDSAAALDSLGSDALWAAPNGIASAGFHAKHLAGSTERLCTYLEGRPLSPQALAATQTEGSGEETQTKLQQAIAAAFARYEKIVRSLAPHEFGSIRHVGRKRIAVTAISLAIHIAEHGQRHTGQLITTARFIRARAG